MSLEDELFRQRFDRIRDIEKLGFQPYGHRFDASHTIAQIMATHGTATGEELENNRVPVRIAGRVQTVRRMGKAGFAHILQGGERLQVYVRKDAVPQADYELYQFLDLGDIIGVDGYLFRTRTGELSVHAGKLTFLSKTLLSMPEKWHGLEDVETRYRQRYLDLIANPDVQRVFITRSRIIASLRRQLDSRGFIEVETPMMQPLYGGAAARPFVTHHNTLDIDLYLRIAPELYLKRLVVGGLERVYEINRNFRNEGISTQHNPEFTMLEFYQAYADYVALIDFSEELLKQTAIDATGAAEVEYQGAKLDFSHLRRYTMREAVIEFWNGLDKPSLDNVRDPEWLARQSTKPTPGERLVELFENTVERQLVQPTVIYEYPVENSPLSKNNADDPSMVDRFEIYVAGMEIGNAYTELNDPLEQRRRFDMQRAMRERGDEEAHQMDEDFLRALSYGMPPTAGEGLGIDRITMVLTNSRSIRDVILFPLLRPEGDIGLAGKLRELDEPPAVKNFELFIARRYLRAKRKTAVISVITVISIAGVAAGVMALIIALAINNGFRNSLQRNLLGATAHIQILEKEPGEGIEDWRKLADRLRRVKHVTAVAPTLYGAVYLTGPRQSAGAVIKGVNMASELSAAEVLLHLKQGSLDRLNNPGGRFPGIILGARLAQSTGMLLNSVITVISPQGEVYATGPRPSYKNFRVVGIFESGFYELDNAWAYVTLPEGQKLFSLGDVVNSIELKVDDVDLAPEVAKDIEKMVGPKLAATSWKETNRSIMSALRMEKVVTVVTIGLIQLVAALNILITLVMMVMEKHKDIAILMSMGARRAQIRNIFVLQGMLIGVVGTAIGLVAGYSLSYLANTYHWIPLDAEVYSLSFVPFDSRGWDGLWVAGVAILVSFVATVYPARNATRIVPVEAIRYE